MVMKKKDLEMYLESNMYGGNGEYYSILSEEIFNFLEVYEDEDEFITEVFNLNMKPISDLVYVVLDELEEDLFKMFMHEFTFNLSFLEMVPFYIVLASAYDLANKKLNFTVFKEFLEDWVHVGFGYAGAYDLIVDILDYHGLELGYTIEEIMINIIKTKKDKLIDYFEMFVISNSAFVSMLNENIDRIDDIFLELSNQTVAYRKGKPKVMLSGNILFNPYEVVNYNKMYRLDIVESKVILVLKTKDPYAIYRKQAV